MLCDGFEITPIYRKLDNKKHNFNCIATTKVDDRIYFQGMLNKYSNIATSKMLKEHLNMSFTYDYLYRPKRIIDGFYENSVALVTSATQDRIQFGIWGLLPQNYNDDWKLFQLQLNTLEISITQLKTSKWLFDIFLNRRCLILATGYFTSKIIQHTLIPFYHSLKYNRIFCFAGIYTVLEDGFITFSILSRPFNTDDILESTHPIILDADHYHDYLTGGFPIQKFLDSDYEIDYYLLTSRQISQNDLRPIPSFTVNREK